MSQPLLAALVGLFLIWPLLGQYAIRRFDRRRENRGKPAIIPPADTPTEILARMYLWPIVLHRYRRAARQFDNPGDPTE
ncbi:MAG: hypothetical protein H6981_03240 [Gammaproteobacteria bacterium]|nr:hypothetical protein [Gammaproteobacteria bacterium]